MRLNPFPHISEEYYCINCRAFNHLIEVSRDWKCPKCKNPVHIRVKTKDKDNACFRIKIQEQELEVNDLILLNRDDDFRRVLNLKKEGSKFRVAIEKYRVLTINEGSYILKINGRWYH